MFEEEVVDGIDAVSRFFEPLCIEIETCELEVMSNPNFNEPRDHLFDEMIGLHSKPNRIDLFVVNLPASMGCYRLEGNVNSPEEGNIFIDTACVNRMGQAFGFFFGLKNTFHDNGNGAELSDGSNCATTADEICDTPADPFRSDTLVAYVRNCEFILEDLDANGDYYSPDVGNVMGPYSACWCGFSREQLMLMYANIRNAPVRYW